MPDLDEELDEEKEIRRAEEAGEEFEMETDAAPAAPAPTVNEEPAQTTVAQPAAVSAPAPAPSLWDTSTIKVSMVFGPVDGKQGGRPLGMGIQVAGAPPVFWSMRENDFRFPLAFQRRLQDLRDQMEGKAAGKVDDLLGEAGAKAEPEPEPEPEAENKQAPTAKKKEGQQQPTAVTAEQAEAQLNAFDF
jgi:hypothetical protein